MTGSNVPKQPTIPPIPPMHESVQMNNIISICPFRTYTEVRPALMVGHGDVTVSGFMGCLKDKCPAWWIEDRVNLVTNERVAIEHCKRLDNWR